jgi:tripartite-type tricarboxylate transporter receptor subunit TctC
VRLVVITNHESAPYAPDVLTANEAGYPVLTFDGLVGLFASPQMDAAVRKRVEADVIAVASDPTVVKLLEANNQLVRPGDAKSFAENIDTQRSQLAAAAKILGSDPVR